MLSIQKITWFVNDCGAFRQKTTICAGRLKNREAVFCCGLPHKKSRPDLQIWPARDLEKLPLKMPGVKRRLPAGSLYSAAADASGLFSTRDMSSPAISARDRQINICSMCGCAGAGRDLRAAPIPPYQENTEAACERESREGNTARPDEKTHTFQVYWMHRQNATSVGEIGKENLPGGKDKRPRPLSHLR